jgi:uncharacterized protein (DUF697 family)
VGLPVGMVAGLAAAASVAVGLGVVASGVVRLAVSGAGSVVSAEPRSVAGSAELEHFPSALNRRDSQPLSRRRIWGN